MRICFVGPANSAHIIKWCNWFSTRNHEVHVVSFTNGEIPDTKVHLIDANVDPTGNDLQKIKYLFAGRKIKRTIKLISPDIVNVHYATSYGISVALTNLNNYILSVWGSDIYSFPKKSPLHSLLLRISLNKASLILSTSQTMASEASQYTKKMILTTPFGVDMSMFNPDKKESTHDSNLFVVGTVKALADIYGIKNIIEAVAEIFSSTEIPIRLRIAGTGQKEIDYMNLANDLGISEITDWLGYISPEQAAIEWANMDVALIPSIHESFGVAAIEAQACGTAVIISDIPGLKETTNPNYSSLILKNNNSQELKSAIMMLYENPELREKMGREGRLYVQDKYELDRCFNRIDQIFNGFIKGNYSL